MKTILVVEDVAMNRDLITQLLEEDYRVIEAADGLEGLRLAEQEHPDLILSDLSLPGMDGWTLIARLRAMEELKGVPIIVVTAHAMTGDDRRAVEAGCDDYLTKPIDEDRLLSLQTRAAVTA